MLSSRHLAISPSRQSDSFWLRASDFGFYLPSESPQRAGKSDSGLERSFVAASAAIVTHIRRRAVGT